MQRPRAWEQWTPLDPAGSVQASFYNPDVGGETLAVYAVPAEGKQLIDLGSATEYGKRQAGAAPDCELLSAEALTGAEDGRKYYITHILYYGVSAGLFKEAHEFRSVTIHEGVQYTCRVTAVGAHWDASPRIRDLLRAVALSFRVA